MKTGTLGDVYRSDLTSHRSPFCSSLSAYLHLEALALLSAWSVLPPESSTATGLPVTCFKSSLKSHPLNDGGAAAYLKCCLSTPMGVIHLSCFLCFSLALILTNTLYIYFTYLLVYYLSPPIEYQLPKGTNICCLLHHYIPGA